MLDRNHTFFAVGILFAASTVGCSVQFVNTPSVDKVHNGIDVLGEYSFDSTQVLQAIGNEAEGIKGTGEKGTAEITRSESKQFPYRIVFDMPGPPKDEILCQIFRIDDLDLAFVKYKNKNGPAKFLFAFNIMVTSDKIEAKPIDEAFFKANPKALAQIRPTRNAKFLIASDAGKLDEFFQEHQQSKSLFDHERTIVLERAE